MADPQDAGGPSSNPVASLSGAVLRLAVPKVMTVRLTDTSRLAQTDVGTLFFTIFLSFAIGFGTSYFTAKEPSNSLFFEFMGWVVASLVTLVVILVLKLKTYREPTHLIAYQPEYEQVDPKVGAKT